MQKLVLSSVLIVLSGAGQAQGPGVIACYGTDCVAGAARPQQGPAAARPGGEELLRRYPTEAIYRTARQRQLDAASPRERAALTGRLDDELQQLRPLWAARAAAAPEQRIH